MNEPNIISSPFATGGGGVTFEHQVQTAFVVLMLANGFAPHLLGKKITKIELQCKHQGFSTDDMVVYTTDPETNSEHKLLAQIKSNISISDSDQEFQKVIQSAWKDFNNDLIFKKDRDIIVLITGPLSKTDIINTRTILEWAKCSNNETEYFEKINKTNFSSDKKREKLNVFRNSIKKANHDKEVSNELIFLFLKHFYIIGYDFDIKDGVARSLLVSIINQFQNEVQAEFVWSRIFEEVAYFNKNAGTITLENISENIKKFFTPKRYIPQEYIKASLITNFYRYV